MLPTSGLFNFHCYTGLIIRAFGLATGSFASSFCSNKKKKTRYNETEPVHVENKQTACKTGPLSSFRQFRRGTNSGSKNVDEG